MDDALRILVIEDSQADFVLIERELGRSGRRLECRRVQSRHELEAALALRWDAVLADYSVPGMRFEDSLALIGSRLPDIPMILVSGSIGEERAVELLRLGVWDFVLKDNTTRLLSVLERCLHEAEEARRLQRVEQALRESRERDYDLIENSRDFICTHDLEGNVLSVNAAVVRATGYPKEALLGKNLADFLSLANRAGFAAYLNEIRSTGSARGRMRVRTASGEMRWWEYDNSLRTEGVTVPVVRGMAHDVTERLAAEARVEQLTRLYAALSHCNQAIVTSASEEELFRRICQIAVEFGGMKMAWIGRVDEARQVVLPVTSHGDGTRYLQDIRIALAADDPAGRGPTGTAIREHCPCWCQDFLHDPRTALWHERGAQAGWRASASLPLYRNGVLAASFTLYARHAQAFGESERELLVEMAQDISHALDGLDHEARRREREQWLKTLSRAIEQSPVSIAIAGLDGKIQYVNPKVEQVTGYNSAELIGKSPKIFQSGEMSVEEYRELWATITAGKTWRGEFHNRRKDGSLFWEDASISPIVDEAGEPINYVAVKEDITERKAAEEKIQHLAYYDALTGLPNRRLLVDRLQQALAANSRTGKAGALLLIDLDNFKTLNDTLGHDVGDLLLQQVGERLAGCVREGDSLARLGGDEFVVMLEDLSGQAQEAATQAEAVGEKILAALNRPYPLAAHEHRSTPSIGITLFADHDESVDELLKRADLAMYQAKAAGRNTLRFFDPEIQAMIMARATLEVELRQALDRGEFLLHYQPKVSCASGAVTGFEALLRWQHQERGLIGPDEIIPMLEDTGLIVAVGAWVLETACVQARRWQDAGLGTPSVAVNISGRQIHVGDLCATVAAALAASGLEPAQLELELTESQLMKDAEGIIDLLRRLKAMGVSLSVDDFGTGYSSLAYLKRFPIDSLKVDRAFVRDIIADPNDVSITRAIITLAHSLKLKVVAEGVETEGQLGLLIANHCDEIQGYYFSRPLPAEGATALLASGRSLDSRMLAGLARRRTLLLVDDEENILSSLKRLLRRDGYDVLTALGAAQGLELLASHPVDVIVSDQRMPGMSGVEFLRRVKTLHPETVRLVLSGYTDLQAVTDAINEGAIYKFLTKPWDDGILRANIEEAFRNKEMADENRRLHSEVAQANSRMAAVNLQLQQLLASKDLQVLRDEASLDIAQEVLQQLPWPIIGIDDERAIALANAAADFLCGGAAPLLGRTIDGCLPAALIAALDGAARAEAEVEIDGVRYHMRASPMGETSRSNGTLLVLLPREATS